ncbi:hypothetical MAP kinase [Postia placenta Mad-698-R]|nr:hypothetical MAP kinase [Postia placenta Mad-698-R]
MQRHTFTALNSTFVVDSEYQFVKELGQGAYGCVVSAKHRRSGEGCAIKKITNINTKITCLYDMDIVFRPDGNFDEVYLYEELMEADLHAIMNGFGDGDGEGGRGVRCKVGELVQQRREVGPEVDESDRDPVRFRMIVRLHGAAAADHC